ncbi:hypothetical protein ABZX12_13605 [Kribbella sp. NPDC003505]|uniref:hypothetical protein n=1 Tax=Kribbella sp. NPDC003505 TaxID=3154448 RepID=UPI00339F04CE
MGQFKQYIESYDPSAVRRIFYVVVPLAAIVRAVATRQLEPVLLAAFLVVLLLPPGIAPKGAAQMAAYLEARPVLGSVHTFFVLTCGGFVLLASFLSRHLSLLLAVGLGLSGVVGQLWRWRRTASSPRPGGRGELG